MFLLPTALKREKATVQQRRQPHNHWTKPTTLHALPYNRRLVSGLACSLNSPGRNSSHPLPTCTGPLGFAWIFTAISTSCLRCAAWPLLWFQAVLPGTHQPAAEGRWSLHPEKSRRGTRQGKRRETVQRPEQQKNKGSFEDRGTALREKGDVKELKTEEIVQN